MGAIYITLRDLVRAGACEAQKKQFFAVFKHRALVTVTNAVANAPFFDWSWGADIFLQQPYRKQYFIAVDRHIEAFDKAMCSVAYYGPEHEQVRAAELIIVKRGMAKAFAEALLAQGGVHLELYSS